MAALERTIRGAAEGMSVFDPAIVEVAGQSNLSGLDRLTGQQSEVLSYLAQGYGNRESIRLKPCHLRQMRSDVDVPVLAHECNQALL